MALVTPSKYPNSVLVTVPSWIKAASRRLLVVSRDCLEEREAVRPLISVMARSSVVMVACFASSAACNPDVFAMVRSLSAMESLLYSIPAAAFMFALVRFVMEFPVASTSMVLLVKVSVEEAVVFESSCV